MKRTTLYDTLGFDDLEDYKGCGDWPIFMPSSYMRTVDKLKSLLDVQVPEKNIPAIQSVMKVMSKSRCVHLSRRRTPLRGYTFMPLSEYEALIRRANTVISKMHKPNISVCIGDYKRGGIRNWELADVLS